MWLLMQLAESISPTHPKMTQRKKEKFEKFEKFPVSWSALQATKTPQIFTLSMIATTADGIGEQNA
jgi:hypothetical protein